ncbi:MAG: hypothetical protein ABH816_02410 [Candidatus Levyibacteriota bacterium]
MKKIKTLLLCTGIFFIAIFLTFAYGFYTKKSSLSLLKSNYSKQSIVNFPRGELLSGSKASGEFQAKENNLGIIEIRFNTYGRINTDSIIFRLKEKESDIWYYEQVYNAKEFGGYPLFPFGFPIINNSKGKEYSFELESLNGKPGNAIGISQDEPVFISEYKFSKKELLADKKALFFFLFKKSGELTQDFYILRFSLLIFLVLISPLLLFKLFSKANILKHVKKLQMRSKKEVRLFKEYSPFKNVFIRFISKAIIVVFEIFSNMRGAILRIVKLAYRLIMKILFYFFNWLEEE